MKTQRLLIADCSDDFRTALAAGLAGQFEVRVARDGDEAWKELQRFTPDVFLLDVMLPGTDGITLLRQCAEASIRPAILVTTRLYSEFIVNTLARLGVSYILPKPCQIAAVTTSVRELSNLPPPSPAPAQPTVHDILLQLGFSRKLSGTRYLQQAIRMFAKDPQQMLTKELYGSVGQLFHASPSQVERCIRNAIVTSWGNRDDRVWQRYFPTGKDGTVRRPTNGELITRLSECMTESPVE